MVVAQLVMRLLLTPEICSSNPIIGNFYLLSAVLKELDWKGGNKEKEAGSGALKKSTSSCCHLFVCLVLEIEKEASYRGIIFYFKTLNALLWSLALFCWPAIHHWRGGGRGCLSSLLKQTVVDDQQKLSFSPLHCKVKTDFLLSLPFKEDLTFPSLVNKYQSQP